MSTFCYVSPSASSLEPLSCLVVRYSSTSVVVVVAVVVVVVVGCAVCTDQTLCYKTGLLKVQQGATTTKTLSISPCL